MRCPCRSKSLSVTAWSHFQLGTVNIASEKEAEGLCLELCCFTLHAEIKESEQEHSVYL